MRMSILMRIVIIYSEKTIFLKTFMNEFIILFRETLEAALIVGIIYLFLDC